MSVACIVAAVVALSGAAFAARFLPARAADPLGSGQAVSDQPMAEATAS